MILTSLNSINKLDKLEVRKQKKHKKKTKQETQLLVSISKTLALTNSSLVYFIIDFFNPFDNLNFVVLLANYDFLDLF
jgi:GTP-binding protein EngB required for normal cell division